VGRTGESKSRAVEWLFPKRKKYYCLSSSNLVPYSFYLNNSFGVAFVSRVPSDQQHKS
jgi:hypothetical protein